MSESVHEAADSRREWWRESVTMALYIGLSLLAVLVALPKAATSESDHAARTIFLTAVALLFAHQFAFRLSSRLVNKGELDEEVLRALGAQTAGGLVAAVIATLPVLLFGGSAVWLSELAVLLLVALVGYRVARSAGRSSVRAILYVGLLAVVVGVILALKALVGH